MATQSADMKRVRFNLDQHENIDSMIASDDLGGQWDFLKYLLTLREEFNVNSVVDSLVQKGVVSADAGTEIFRQGNIRAQIEMCIQEVMKGGPGAYTSICETLREHGYSNIVDALGGDGSMSALVPELSELPALGARPKDSYQGNYSQEYYQGNHSASSSHSTEDLSVTGRKMALSALSREAKTSQKEFSVIVERQHELEKQLVQVMKSLDTAKDMLIRERQEKLGLRDQLKGRDEDLVNMQKKYLELQKAMGILRETNNKYHEKVTKLQIENEQLRKGMKDKNNLEVELTEKNNELSRLKEQLEKQERQMINQEKTIVQKLSMIESVVSEHKRLVEGQDKLNEKISKQASEINRLADEKSDSQGQIASQQRQLNFQQAQIVMLQESMQRLESHFTGGSSSGHLDMTAPGSPDNRNNRYMALSKGVTLKPFNTTGKVENSKNTHWKNDMPGAKKYR